MNRIYLIGRGKLIVKQKNIIAEIYENNEKRSFKIPINNISLLFCIGKFGFSPLSLRNLLYREIVTVLMQNEKILGFIMPTNLTFSEIGLKQYEKYLNERLEYAKKFIEGLKISSVISLFYFKDKLAEEKIEKIINIEIRAKNIQELMGIEASIWKELYDFIRYYIPNFTRVYNPPLGYMNALISFGNSLLYSVIFNECVKEFLNPKIGFLHEIRENRNSLVLDISEIFKPFLLLLLNLNLIRKEILKDIHFNNINGYTYLNDLGKTIYIKYFESFLKETIYSSHFKRKVSIYELIKMEIRKLKNSIINSKRYKPLSEICL